MNIITSRAPDPDIPLSEQWEMLDAKDLVLQLVRQKFMTIRQIEQLREKAPVDLQCANPFDFMTSPLGRSHLRSLFEVMKQPAMLPELAHAATLATQRIADQLADVQRQTEDQIQATAITA